MALCYIPACFKTYNLFNVQPSAYFAGNGTQTALFCNANDILTATKGKCFCCFFSFALTVVVYDFQSRCNP